MFMLLEEACKVFAVPQPYLYDSAKRIENSVITRNGKRYVHFDNAGKSLGLGVAVLRDMHTGHEWLMTAEDIVRVYGDDYGCNYASFKHIAGEPVIAPEHLDIHQHVYRTSPFIRFAKLTLSERLDFLGGVPNGSRDQSSDQKVRRSNRVPRKDGAPRGKRGRPPKRLGS